MLKKTFASCAIVIACFFVSTGAYPQPAPAVLTIQVDKSVSKVSPTLYGLMTEEINYSYDGGLYAEMVRNRTFRSRLVGHSATGSWWRTGDARRR